MKAKFPVGAIVDDCRSMLPLDVAAASNCEMRAWLGFANWMASVIVPFTPRSALLVTRVSVHCPVAELIDNDPPVMVSPAGCADVMPSPSL